jgi:Secretion system C-terminal sorting domain
LKRRLAEIQESYLPLNTKRIKDSLKNFLFIASIILFTAVQTQGQITTSNSGDPIGPVIKYYPNPATSFITFDFQDGYQKGYDIQIYNFPGQKVFEQKNLTARTIINLSDFNRGIYIFQLKDASGKIIRSNKFQVSK